jgi:F0F1-type ATP synthase membrane subunit c/vacuolar-type H+-ATPase subunit K
MGKKKNDDEDNDDVQAETEALLPIAHEVQPNPRQRTFLPVLGIGDILALLALIVLSAALLLEGYHKEFRDYSKEIVALFAVVIGFLLGRKT